VARRGFTIDPEAGGTGGGTWATSPVAVGGPAGWYTVTFAHAGVGLGEGGAPSASSIGMRITPAAASADATNTATVFDPRLRSTRDTAELLAVPTFLEQAGNRSSETALA